MAKPSKPEPELTDEDIAKRRDEALRRLLKSPPKPHAEIAGKRNPKVKKKKTPAK